MTAEPIAIAFEVCDSCLLVAHDLGARNDYEQQSFIMQETGEHLPDHICDAKEEPDIFPQGCACGCYVNPL